MDLNGRCNYAVHILRIQNTESSPPYLKNFGKKPQDKNKLILHKTIINTRWKKVTDIVQGFVRLFQDS